MSKPSTPLGAFSILGVIAAVIWLLFVILAYSYQYPGYFKLIKTLFSDPVFYVGFGLLIAGWGYLNVSIFSRIRKLSMAALMTLFSVVLFLLFITAMGHSNGLDDYINSSGYMHALSKAGISLFCMLLLVVSALVAGGWIIKNESLTKSFVLPVRLAVGLMVITLAMFFLGAINLLNSMTAWGLLGLITASGIREIPGLFVRFIDPDGENGKMNLTGLISVSILTVFIVLNFIATLVPFPLGWDSLSLYVNISKLIGDYNGLVPGQQAYNWSLLMSLGYLLVGKGSVALAISFLGGVLSVGAIYGLARKWTDKNNALLASAIMYTLPVVTFQSVKDYKIDLGLLFIGVVVIMLLVEWFGNSKKSSFLKPIDGFDVRNRESWYALLSSNSTLLIAGLLTGFAFGIKYTSVFIMFSFLIGIGYLINGYLGFISMTSIVLFLTFQFHLDMMSGLRLFHVGVGWVKWTLMGVFLLCGLWIYLRDKKKLRRTVIGSLLYLIPLSLTFSPWIGKNIIESGSLSPSTILFGGKSEIDQLMLDDLQEKAPIDIAQLPTGLEQFKHKPDPAAMSESAKVEEIQRFMGYEPGPVRYLSLPVDVSLGLNIPGKFAAIGFLFIFFIPLILARVYNAGILKQIAIFVLWVLILGLSFWGAAVSKGLDLNVMPHEVANQFYSLPGNGPLLPILQFLTVITLLVAWPFKSILLSDHMAWYFLTYPFIFLLFGATVWSLTSFLKSRSRSQSGLIILFLAYSFIWMILSGGIVWYGYHMLALTAIAIGYFLHQTSENRNSNLLYYPAFSAVIIWFLFSYSSRIATLSPESTAVTEQVLSKPHVGYLLGQYTEESLLDHIQPLYAELAAIINEDENGRVYRVGTFLPFFIEKNSERVFTDNQLDIFKRLLEAYEDKEELAARLSELGFEYLVIDLNTHTIDQTPEKTLTNKYIDFMRFVQQNPRLRLVRTDRTVSDPFREEGPDNPTVEGVFGRIKESGTIAVYKIL